MPEAAAGTPLSVQCVSATFTTAVNVTSVPKLCWMNGFGVADVKPEPTGFVWAAVDLKPGDLGTFPSWPPGRLHQTPAPPTQTRPHLLRGSAAP